MTRQMSSVALLLVVLSVISCTTPPQSTEEALPEATEEVASGEQPEEQEVVTSADTIIRLDPNAEDLEVWKERDISEDPPREPGPIKTFGPLTFFGLPIAMTPEDLVAGEVEVAFIAAPVDMGSGYRGAGEGPTAMRAVRRGAAAWRRW